MVKLSERLMLIAEQIKKNEIAADIGTDHGFLPMYLADESICPKVILADVSTGSLDKAKSNVRELLKAREEAGCPLDPAVFDFRLGDGIKVLAPGEADVIVRAGMGGILISEILAGNRETAHRARRIIMQPRNGSGRLRYYLIKNGFKIERDLLVREGKFICEVIVASISEAPNREMGIDAQNGKIDRILDDGEMPAPYGDISYDVPKMLLKNGEIAREYIERKLCTEKKILAEISAANAQNTERKKDSNAEEAALDSAESGEEIRSRLKEVKAKILYYEKLLADGGTYK